MFPDFSAFFSLGSVKFFCSVKRILLKLRVFLVVCSCWKLEFACHLLSDRLPFCLGDLVLEFRYAVSLLQSCRSLMILTCIKDRFWMIEVFVRDVVRPLPTISLYDRKVVWVQQFNCKNDVKPILLTHGVELVILAEGSMGIYLDMANRACLFPGIIKWERMWNSYIYRM